MSNTIRTILEHAGDTPMKDLPVLMKALKMANILTPVKGNVTANQMLFRLMNNDPDVLNQTVTGILKPNTSKGVLHDCKTVVMWFMLVAISGAFAGANIYTAVSNGVLIGWEDMALTLIGPILVVLYDRGILSKENRDILNILAGNNPTLTVMESISQRIANGGKSKQVAPKKHEHVEVLKETKDVDY